MISINKLKEPNSLLAHRKSGGNYENLSSADKMELRHQLLEEQGHICCYCLRRIPEEKLEMHHTKIEHFKCQTKYAEKDLEYSNLFLACRGNEGNGKGNQFCDTAKGDADINSFNLLDPNINNLIYYTKNGTISSYDTGIDEDIKLILNLNDQSLQSQRAAVWKGISYELARLNRKAQLTKGNLIKLRTKMSNRNSRNQYRQYFPVILYYLQRKIDKL